MYVLVTLVWILGKYTLLPFIELVSKEMFVSLI